MPTCGAPRSPLNVRLLISTAGPQLLPSGAGVVLPGIVVGAGAVPVAVAVGAGGTGVPGSAPEDGELLASHATSAMTAKTANGALYVVCMSSPLDRRRRLFREK